MEHFSRKLTVLKEEKDTTKLQKRVETVQTIQSKLAQFYILDTHLSLKKDISLTELLDTWLAEIQLLARIHKIAKRKFTSKAEQAIYFATHCLSYLVFEDTSSISKVASSRVKLEDAILDPLSSTRPCPFTNVAWNFIYSLFTTNSCLCLCYATYIRAAAEEFRYTEYIHLCNSNNMSSIVLTQGNTSYTLTNKDMNTFHVIGLPDFLRNKSSLTVGDTFSTPKVSTLLEVGYITSFYIKLETNIVDFKDKYIEDIPSLHKSVITFTDTKEFSAMTSTKCNRTFAWNDIVTLLSRIVGKRSFKDMITQLLYLGYVYDISEVIDNILLLYLIYTQRDVEYTKWVNRESRWKAYLNIKKQLDRIANIPMQALYTYIENVDL
jgi:hypothetical protein